MLFAERVRRIQSIVYLDDDHWELRACVEALQPRVVHTTTRVADVVELTDRTSPDVVLVDFFLGAQRGYAPDGASLRRYSLGTNVVRQLRERHPGLTIVVVSGGSCDPFRHVAKAAGADAMIHKLVGWRKIIDIVEADMLTEPPRAASPSLAMRTHELVAQAYVDNEFNASRTARELQITRNTLYRKLKSSPLK